VLSEVRQICTRVAILNLGRLVTESTVEDLLRGHGEFSVRVEEPEQALALVRTAAWGQAARLDGSAGLITASPDGRGRTLNAFLSQAGFTPDALGPAEQDLEDVFLQLTGNGQGGVQ